MMVAEEHLWCLMCILTLLTAYMLYVFVYDHKEELTDSDWIALFIKEGFSKEQIDLLSHDQEVWYYDRKSTCVGYGDKDEKCQKFQYICTGGKTFGSPNKQVKEIKRYIISGFKHPLCPLVYEGAD